MYTSRVFYLGHIYDYTGEKVKLVRKDMKITKDIYIDVAISNKYGKYKFVVREDHKYKMCDVMLLKNSDNGCFKIPQGREQSCVILNHYNVIALQTRQANNSLKNMLLMYFI